MNIHQPQNKSKALDRLPERLHHFGFVVKDQEVNRQFFEDVLGIPLIATWCERAHNVVVGREINYCHTFYALADGGALAFFQFEDADAYEALLQAEIFAGIAGRQIQGYRGIELLRRPQGAEVEFVTLMRFDSLDAVRSFAGDDYEAAVVPPRARELLARFDARSAHYEVR